MAAEVAWEGVGSPARNRGDAIGPEPDADREGVGSPVRNREDWVEAEPDREGIGFLVQNQGGAVEPDPDCDREGIGSLVQNRGGAVEADPDGASVEALVPNRAVRRAASLDRDANLAVVAEVGKKASPVAVDLNWAVVLLEELEKILVSYERALACRSAQIELRLEQQWKVLIVKMQLEFLSSCSDRLLGRFDYIRPLAKVNFCPPNPPSLGGTGFKVPQNWGASAVLGSPQVEHLAWI